MKDVESGKLFTIEKRERSYLSVSYQCSFRDVEDLEKPRRVRFHYSISETTVVCESEAFDLYSPLCSNVSKYAHVPISCVSWNDLMMHNKVVVNLPREWSAAFNTAANVMLKSESGEESILTNDPVPPGRYRVVLKRNNVSRETHLFTVQAPTRPQREAVDSFIQYECDYGGGEHEYPMDFKLTLMPNGGWIFVSHMDGTERERLIGRYTLENGNMVALSRQPRVDFYYCNHWEKGDLSLDVHLIRIIAKCIDYKRRGGLRLVSRFFARYIDCVIEVPLDRKFSFRGASLSFK